MKKCNFCSNEIQDNELYCSNCGKKQKNVTNNSSGGKWIIISIISVILIAIIAIIAIILLNPGKRSKNSNKYPFYGTWTCSDGQVLLEIDEENFNMNYGTSSSVESKYTFEKIDDSRYRKFSITANANKVIINGVENKQRSTAIYEISMELGNDDQLLMVNADSYNMYNCSRKSKTNNNTETKTIKENHYVIGTDKLGYIAVPKTWTYRTADLGNYIYIEEDVDFNINMSVSTNTNYEEYVKELKEGMKKTRMGYSYNVDEKNTKVGKYDAVLLIATEDMMYEYAWVFKTEDSKIRSITIRGTDKNLIEKYTYLVESYSVNRY